MRMMVDSKDNGVGVSKKESVTPRIGTVQGPCVYLFHNWLVLRYNNDVKADVGLDVIYIFKV